MDNQPNRPAVSRETPFKKGNQFWKARTSVPAQRMFADPQGLYEAILEYFKWAEENPLYSEKVSFDKYGNELRAKLEHPRAMTIWGLCNFLGIIEKTWASWRSDREDFLEVIVWAEASIKQQKFEAASVGLMNPGLIAREIGLADRRIVEGTPPTINIFPPDGDDPGMPLGHDPDN